MIEGMQALANLLGCIAISVELDFAFLDGLPTGGWSLAVFLKAGFSAIHAGHCRTALKIRHPLSENN
jgi:hypothetical protein